MYMYIDLYCHHLLQLERYMYLKYSNHLIYFFINSPTYLFLALIMLILDENAFSMLCSSMKKSDQTCRIKLKIMKVVYGDKDL